MASLATPGIKVVPIESVVMPESLKGKISKAYTELYLEEEEQRRLMEKEVDLILSTDEQSALWKCLNDKVDEELNYKLSQLIRKRMSMNAPNGLYRGVNRRMYKMLVDLDVGEEFTTQRVVSFSSELSTAREFSGHGIYGTKTIIRWLNPPMAYNYQEDMLMLLKVAPNCEFSSAPYDPDAKIDRRNKLEMVEGENEWMMPVGTTFRISSITEENFGPGLTYYTIYDVELITL